MKRYLFLSFALLLVANLLTAQEINFQKEINDQVWRPFIKTYNSFDTEGFMAIHTKDIIRINRDGGSIRIGEEYKTGMQQGNERSLKNNYQRSIEFRFLERLARSEVAFEVGYYKVTSKRGDADERVFYGKFHVVLKKEDGLWKLDMDSDTSNKGLFNETHFQSGKKMEDWDL